MSNCRRFAKRGRDLACRKLSCLDCVDEVDAVACDDMHLVGVEKAVDERAC